MLFDDLTRPGNELLLSNNILNLINTDEENWYIIIRTSL